MAAAGSEGGPVGLAAPDQGRAAAVAGRTARAPHLTRPGPCPCRAAGAGGLAGWPGYSVRWVAGDLQRDRDGYADGDLPARLPVRLAPPRRNRRAQVYPLRRVRASLEQARLP